MNPHFCGALSALVTNPLSAVPPRRPSHAPGTAAAVHRGVHGSGYGFTGPYTEFSLRNGTATRGRDPYTYPYFSRYLHTGPTPYAADVNSERLPRAEPRPAALRDATDIVARTAADEADAIAARERYRADGIGTIAPDPEIASRLGDNERLIETRPGAMVGRAQLTGVGGIGGAAGEDGAGTASSAAQGVDALSGRLYLTTSRLVLLSRPADRPTDTELSVGLVDIEELACVGERLLVSLADGTGLTIDAGRPRLLRVQIAAARAASRGEQKADEEPEASPGIPGLNPAILPLEA